MTAVRAARTTLALACVFVAFDGAEAQSLRGSAGSLNRQNRVARQHDFTYLNNAAQVRRFVDAGYLVRVRDGQDHLLRGVAFPYARPEVALFVSRLGRQYRRACGEQLVVTSLTRPRTRQPRNASPRSVHPTGMAMDIRRSRSRACRAWLEDTLLTLEGQGVLEALRESRPPHYHVAVFPAQYASYVETVQLSNTAGGRDHRVRRGDSLWTIARRYGTTVRELRSANKLRGSRIYAGQVLTVP
jgi:hypothetical protein